MLRLKKKADSKAIVIDGMNACYRSFHKLNHLKTTTGMKSGLIYGFIQSLLFLQKRHPGWSILVLWDTKSTIRYELYPEYKARRKAKRDTEEYEELIARVDQLKEILKSHNVIQMIADGYEADDLATIPCDGRYSEVILVTGDRDWLQLLDDEKNIRVLKPGKPDKLYREETFMEEFGFPPANYTVFKCLKGDKSDNIKGIARFPTKIATELAINVGNIESFFYDKNCLKDVPERWRTEIGLAKEQLRINHKLVTLYRNMQNLKVTTGTYDPEKLRGWYEMFEMDKLLLGIKKERILKNRGGEKPKSKPRRFKVKVS